MDNKEPIVKQNLYKIYYINLDERPDRRDYMDDLLSKLEVPFEKHSGFKPIFGNFRVKGTYENYFYNRARVKSRIFIKSVQNELMGIIGCLGSYIQLLEKIKDETPPFNQYIIILEDDAFISTLTLNKINQTMNENQDIDILRINPTFFKNAIKLNAVDEIKPDFYKITRNTYYCGGTHINVIPTCFIHKIINYLKKSIVMPIDSLFSFNYLQSYFLFINEEYSFNEELRLKNDIPKEKKPAHKQLLNYKFNTI